MADSDLFWGADSALFWPADDSALFWETEDVHGTLVVIPNWDGFRCARASRYLYRQSVMSAGGPAFQASWARGSNVLLNARRPE